MMKRNYSNKDDVPSSPLKKGRMKDVVKPTRPKVRRIRGASLKDQADELYIDLVQVFANRGITLSNVHTMAMDLVKRGWSKQKRIENPKERS